MKFIIPVNSEEYKRGLKHVRTFVFVFFIYLICISTIWFT